jgi:hypothetical protein
MQLIQRLVTAYLSAFKSSASQGCLICHLVVQTAVSCTKNSNIVDENMFLKLKLEYDGEMIVAGFEVLKSCDPRFIFWPENSRRIFHMSLYTEIGR